MPRSEPDSRSHDAPRGTDLAGRKAEDAVTELDSRSLLAGLRRRVIVHQGERYCLQLTRAGKLLLTK
jgi:hemin uptake protein HemP